MRHFLKKWLFSGLLFFAALNSVFAQINWQKDAELNTGLPVGIEVFRGTGTLNGTAIKAVYTVFNPSVNPQLELDVAMGNNVLLTPHQFAALETEKVWVTTNGGFFGGTASNSQVTKNGVVLSPNVKALNRNGQSYFPTRAAFGINPSGEPSVHWIYNIGATNTPYTYPQPSPNNVTQAPQPEPTESFPSLGTIWDAYSAMGGGPMLLKNGVKAITDTAEIFDAGSGVDPSGLAPRTAIGYTDAGKYYLLVVDGRTSAYPGASANMLADIFLSLGCTNAINLDGGGSSAMVVNGSIANVPSDATGIRTVSSVLMVKQKNWIYDTEFGDTYQEIGGTWNQTSNPGFFGPSRSRFIASDPNKKAYYLLKNLPPSGYSLSAWWVAASNRSNRTPYIIKRRNAQPDTVYVNQTTNSAKWNLLGNYQLSAGDTIEISGAGQSGALVTSDAIQLVKNAEPTPVFLLSAGNNANIVKGSAVQFTAKVNSINSGVKLTRLVVKKQFQDGSFERLDSLDYANVDSISYDVNTIASELIGQMVKIVFTVTDTSGQKTETVFQYQVTPLSEIRLVPDENSIEVQKNTVLTLMTELDSKSPAVLLSRLLVYKTIGTGAKLPFDSLLNINTTLRNYNLKDSITQEIRERIVYAFELIDANGDTATREVLATVIPKRGNFRMVVIADLNSSFGETSYEWQVDSIMQRIPRIWKPDLVVSGGDLIAGQSTSYDSARVVAMWNAYDEKIAKPLRDNNIPHAFTMGNHDAASGFNVDRTGAFNYWRSEGKFPGWHPVDTTHYPFYHSFTEKQNGDFFFVSWEASDANLSQADIDWTVLQFQRPEAMAAKYKILIGHMPFYGVAQERDGPGNILSNGDSLRKKMEDLGVQLYVSGHHHAYYPGRRGQMDLLNAGAAGSGPRRWTFSEETAPNTVTLIDFFDDRDTVVYTTYEIQQPNAKDMTVFDEGRLPKAVFGYNGFTRNRNLAVKAEATGMASRYHVAENINSKASGIIQVVQKNGSLKVTGAFDNLSSALLTTPEAIGVYKSSFPGQGELIKALKVKSLDGKSGTFEGLIPLDNRHEILELISVGAFYVLAKTDSFPNGEWRAQLYQENNVALSAASINSQRSDSTYLIRNIEAFFKIDWTKSVDGDLDAAIYTYELALDSNFAEVVFTQATGTAISLGLTQSDLWQLLDSIPLETEKQFYHRVISSDGRQLTKGSPAVLLLKKTNTPVSGNVDLQPPAFVYECARKDADGNCVEAFGNNGSGHGTAVDTFGKVWYHPFSGGLSVKNPDGSFYQLTSPNIRFSRVTAATVLIDAWEPGAVVRQVTLNGISYTINGNRGLGLAQDGNILFATTAGLLKLNAETGEPMRYINLGATGLSNPTADSLGRIFITRVLNNQSFIIKESIANPFGFDTVLSEFALPFYPGTTRASAMAFDGKSLFLPSAGGSFVNRYVSPDGLNFVFDRRIELQGTCNSIHVKQGNKLYVISNKTGNTPPILEYRDFSDTTQIKSWSFPMVDIASEATDIRGLSMNIAGDTFYVSSTGTSKLYKYHIPGNGVVNQELPANPNLYPIIRIKGVKPTGVADSAGVYCRLTGVVQTNNRLTNKSGYDFIMQDSTSGVQVFNLMPASPFLTLEKGDSIEVQGFIRQAFGQIRMVPDSVFILANSKPLNPAVTAFVPEEAFESETIRLDSLILKDEKEWSDTGNYVSSRITAYVMNGDSLNIQLLNQSGIQLQALPHGQFAVRGFVSQFKEELPFTSGYALEVTDSIDLTYTNAVIDSIDYCISDSIMVSIQKFGSFEGDNRFVLQLSDSLGSFTAPVLETMVPLNTNSIKIQVPSAGSRYRVRFNSSVPGLQGGDQGFDLVIHPEPEIRISRDADKLTAEGALQFQWYFNDILIPAPEGINPQLTLGEVGVYKVVGTTGGCSATGSITIESVLPLTFVWVKALIQGNANEITWQTAHEVQVMHYEIERSEGGNQFVSVAKLDAKSGTSNLYRWLDFAGTTGNVFYRIKAIDKDGKLQYSNVVRVYSNTIGEIRVFPNPVSTGSINLQLTQDKSIFYEVTIRDVTGRTLFTKKINHPGGIVIHTLTLPEFAKGTYYLSLTSQIDKLNCVFVVQ